jgi:hypothetical protein
VEKIEVGDEIRLDDCSYQNKGEFDMNHYQKHGFVIGIDEENYVERIGLGTIRRPIKITLDGKVGYTTHECLRVIKKGAKMETLDAKKLLEMNACGDGFRWFVNEYGKNSVPVNEVYDKCEKRGHKSYCKWIKTNFPNSFKTERTYKVGDRFKNCGEECRLIEDASNRHVGLLSTDNWWVYSNTGMHEVQNPQSITHEEMKKICGNPNWENEFKFIED